MTDSSSSNSYSEFLTITAEELELKAELFAEARMADSENTSLEYFETQENLRTALKQSFYEAMSKVYLIEYPKPENELKIKPRLGM